MVKEGSCRGSWRRSGVRRGRSAQASAVSAARFLHGRRKVLEEVPAIGDFQGVRGRLSDGLGEGHQAVTAHDLGQARHLFHERPALALALIAGEPTHVQTDDQPPTADGLLGYLTPISAVDPRGRMLALRTPACRPASRRIDHQVAIGGH